MLRSFVPTAHDVRALVRLGLPIVAAQVGLQLMAMVCVVMVGHISAADLSAVALGNTYVFCLLIFAMGALYALDPILAQAAGARDDHAITLGLQRGLALAVLLGAAISILCLPAQSAFRLAREPAEVVPRATSFVRMVIPGLIPLLLWATLRQALQAMHQTRAVVISSIGGNLANLALNWIFTLGHFGSPVLGAAGAALSMTISRWLMLALIFGFARAELLPRLRPWHPGVFARGPLGRTARIGLPIGIQSSIEYLTFATITVLAGWFGADSLGGHQVAINIASVTFMVPMGFGSAAAVLVGRAIGSGDMPHARRVATSALICGAGFMALCGALMLIAPAALARFYTSVPSVMTVAIALIPIAGAFQIFDGLQVVSAGVLRGAGDTRTPMLVNLLGFWVLGIPVSLTLGFGLKLGVVGLWWGSAVALAAIATMLVTLVRVRLGGAIERVRVEEGAAARSG